MHIDHQDGTVIAQEAEGLWLFPFYLFASQSLPLLFSPYHLPLHLHPPPSSFPSRLYLVSSIPTAFQPFTLLLVKMSSPKEHKEFIQPTEMAYARYLHGTYRHVRQSSIKVGNDHQPRWISIPQRVL